jgi:four helix bundle protein
MRFEELVIWQESIKITKLIYELTAKPPFAHDWGLRDQMRRSVVSISSNIVEGFSKRNNNEFIRFLRIAMGSAGELKSQIHVAHVVHYLNEEQFATLNEQMRALLAQITAFLDYLITLRHQNRRLNQKFNRY